MNIESMKQAAEAASNAVRTHGLDPKWYGDDDFRAHGMNHIDATHIAHCDPQRILKMLAVIEAAQAVIRVMKGVSFAVLEDMDEALEALKS